MQPAPALPRNLLSVLLSRFLRGLGRGLGYGILGVVLFVLAAWIFHRTLLTVTGQPPLVALPMLLFAYAVLGFLCGATIGVTSTVTAHARELAGSLHQPLDRIVQHIEQRLLARRSPQDAEQARRALHAEIGSLTQPLHARMLEFRFGRIWELAMEHRLLRSLLGADNLFFDLLLEGKDPASSGKTVQQFLREKLLDLAADDLRSRLQMAQYLNYAAVIALLLAPPLVVYLARRP